MDAHRAVVGLRPESDMTWNDGFSHVRKDYLASWSGNGRVGMETRVAKLETNVEHIKNSITDIKHDIREFKGEVQEFKKSVHAEFKEVRRQARTDFRLLFGTIITVALGMAGLMAKGFQWL
ncbi:hypothetical protein N5923_12385 [Erwiniaceae bacterium BAC15a-03b]|uniref:Hemolysin XhlA n=1 Tax=Winslowiella arboricola TaxID=2978220 RepID=A0A9J6PLN1_9GAMM|nr:hypothetical protein [Winslowiella arboricola]MCU5772740.1 hypothetical protein [Winslowiella arboricola]MCU5778290.1 hypothetical protein [Winslowiella arboricola]